MKLHVQAAKSCYFRKTKQKQNPAMKTNWQQLEGFLLVRGAKLVTRHCFSTLVPKTLGREEKTPFTQRKAFTSVCSSFQVKVLLLLQQHPH